MIIGLVGKPSAGKSTFFKACTLAEVDIANYPFTTIKPNSGVGYVRVECPDKDFNLKCKPKTGFCINNIRFVPVEIIDVAGLVPDAHLGKGKGNQFLDDLRQADVLIHIVDVSGSLNAQGEPIETGSYDPTDDIKFLEIEIDMWYLGILKKGWEKLAKQIVQEKSQIDKVLADQLSGLKVTEEMMKEVITQFSLNKERPDQWTEEQLKSVATELRIRTKPMIIACNKVDIPGAEEKFKKLKEQFKDYLLVPCSSECELALREAAHHNIIDYTPGSSDFSIKDESKMNDKQKQGLQFIKDHMLTKFSSTGVQDVLDKAIFDLLKYIAVFPVANSKLEDKDGNVLPDCFLTPENSNALDFAYRVHTDLGEKFIRAIDIRKKLTVGKDHILKNRDIIEIVANM